KGVLWGPSSSAGGGGPPFWRGQIGHAGSDSASKFKNNFVWRSSPPPGATSGEANGARGMGWGPIFNGFAGARRGSRFVRGPFPIYPQIEDGTVPAMLLARRVR